MRKQLITIVCFGILFTVGLTLIGLSFVYDMTPFCRGYQQGYVAGYCYGRKPCLKPLPPLCPMPKVGEQTYMNGYERGFIDGLSNS